MQHRPGRGREGGEETSAAAARCVCTLLNAMSRFC